MSNREKFKFANNGKPFEIIIGGVNKAVGIELYDGNCHISDDNVISVNLLSENKTLGRLFKKTITTYKIEVKYKITYFGDITTKVIPVLPIEIIFAKQACEKANYMIDEIKAAKEAYDKEQNEKLAKARKEDTIDAVDVNGEAIKIWRRETYFGDLVLFAEGGQVYHTHADCFESWKPMYRRTFSQWQIIKLSDAKEQGLSECKLCQKYYEDDEEEEAY